MLFQTQWCSCSFLYARIRFLSKNTRWWHFSYQRCIFVCQSSRIQLSDTYLYFVSTKSKKNKEIANQLIGIAHFAWLGISIEIRTFTVAPTIAPSCAIEYRKFENLNPTPFIVQNSKVRMGYSNRDPECDHVASSEHYYLTNSRRSFQWYQQSLSLKSSNKLIRRSKFLELFYMEINYQRISAA